MKELRNLLNTALYSQVKVGHLPLISYNILIPKFKHK